MAHHIIALAYSEGVFAGELLVESLDLDVRVDIEHAISCRVHLWFPQGSCPMDYLLFVGIREEQTNVSSSGAQTKNTEAKATGHGRGKWP